MVRPRDTYAVMLTDPRGRESVLDRGLSHQDAEARATEARRNYRPPFAVSVRRELDTGA